MGLHDETQPQELVLDLPVELEHLVLGGALRVFETDQGRLALGLHRQQLALDLDDLQVDAADRPVLGPQPGAHLGLGVGEERPGLVQSLHLGQTPGHAAPAARRLTALVGQQTVEGLVLAQVTPVDVFDAVGDLHQRGGRLQVALAHLTLGLIELGLGQLERALAPVELFGQRGGLPPQLTHPGRRRPPALLEPIERRQVVVERR